MSELQRAVSSRYLLNFSLASEKYKCHVHNSLFNSMYSAMLNLNPHDNSDTLPVGGSALEKCFFACYLHVVLSHITSAKSGGGTTQ